MKGDKAGRRLPAERSRAGLEASEAFPLHVEFLEMILEQKAREVVHVVPQFCVVVFPEHGKISQTQI